MAHGIKTGKPEGYHLNIALTVTGQEQIEALGRTLDAISRGNELQKYWKTQEELINDVTKAAEQFEKVSNEANATALVNNLNALRAMSGTNNLNGLIDGFDRLVPNIAKAEQLAGKVSKVFSPAEFRDAFITITTLTEYTGDAVTVLNKLSDATSVDDLRAKLTAVCAELSEVKEELTGYKDGAKFTELNEELAETEKNLGKFETTARRAKEEVLSFLKVHDIDFDWSSLGTDRYFEIDGYLDKIDEGLLTSQEVIAKIRTSMSDLFQQSSSYGIIDLDRLQQSVDLTDRETGALQSMATSSGNTADGMKSVMEVMSVFFQSMGDTSGQAQELQHSLVPVIDSLKDLASIEPEKLTALTKGLASLRGLGDISGSNQSLKSLAEVIKSLSQDDVHLENLSLLSTVHLDTFKDLKVSKTILNIAEMSKELNTTKLKALEGMNFENLKALTNIKVSKAAVQQISELTEAIKVLKEAKAASITATDDSVLIDETEASRAQKEAAYLKEATEALNQYYNLRKKYAALFASGDIVEDAGGFLSNTRFGEVANELNRALKTYRELTSEEELQTHKQETINKLAEQELKLRYQLNSASEIATNKAYDRADAEAQSYEKSLAAQAQAIENAYYEIEGAARKSAFKEEQLYIENATKALRDYYNTLKQLQAGFASGAITGDELTGYRTESSEYTVRVDQLNTFLQKKRELIDLEQKEGHQEETLNKITAEKERLEREVLAAKEVATNKQIALDQKQEAAANRQAAAEQSALLKAIELQSRYSLLIGKMSSEKHGAFYTSAVEDRQALDNLIQSFQNGEISLDDFKSRLQILTTSFNTTKDAVNGMSNSTMTAFQRLATMAKKFSYWFSVTRIVMAAYRAFKQMVQSSIELESTFNQLQIVTGATDAEMSKFADTAINLAKGLGQSVTDVTKAIETFSRLGYTLSEAGSLAEFATILSNVANVDLSAATTGLTSIIKGFDLEVSDAEHVSDVLINVGQKFAVSASEMMDAYERAGSALNATNTSFEKSAALIAAANASVDFCRAA